MPSIEKLCILSPFEYIYYSISLISLNFFFKFPILSNLLYNCYFLLFIIFLFDVIVLFDIYRFLYKTCNYFYMFL